jgi:site-specific recombinase XerD
MMQQTGSVAAVDAAADVPLSGPLAKHFRDYLEYRAALGMKPRTHYLKLASFERFLRRRGISELNEINSQMISEWQTEIGAASEHQRRYDLVILSDAFNYLVGQRVLSSSPVKEIPPHRRNSKPPHIFTRTQIAQILDYASRLPDHRLMPYRGATYRLVFLLLYALGLRSQEALNLKIGDIDFAERSLAIVRTKFRKSRVLPFGPRIAEALRVYIDKNPLLAQRNRNSFLFPTESHRTTCLRPNSCHVTLRHIVRRLGIRRSPDSRAPSLHSLRHSFAVHRVEQWHREGVDVNAKLPLLSAFMGHEDVAATQVYLTMTPERLRSIGEKFEDAYGKWGTR